MQDLADRCLLARRKRWLRTRPVVAQRALPSERELLSLEQRIGCALPSDLRGWLSIVGFCDIDDELSFRAEWFDALDPGHLAGAVLFAQDILGRFYGFMPTDGRIVFFARSPGRAMRCWQRTSASSCSSSLTGTSRSWIGWIRSN